MLRRMIAPGILPDSFHRRPPVELIGATPPSVATQPASQMVLLVSNETAASSNAVLRVDPGVVATNATPLIALPA